MHMEEMEMVMDGDADQQMWGGRMKGMAGTYTKLG